MPTKIVKDIPTEVLASSIRDLSRAMQQIKKGALQQRAIIVLLKDMTSLPAGTIQAILDALPQLEKRYLK